MPDFIGAEVIGHARPFAQFNDRGFGERNLVECAAIGSERRRQGFGIPAVVLSAGRGEAVPETVELLRIDRINFETAVEQRLDDGAMRNLDRNMDILWLAAAYGDKPIAHLREALAAVFNGPFAKPLAAGIQTSCFWDAQSTPANQLWF